MTPSSLLRLPTPERWLTAALGDLDTLLHDLAHCEKRAASTVLSFVFRAPDPATAATLSRLAREELTHFEWCLRLLARRGIPFGKLEPAAYAGRLAKEARRQGEGAILDQLLIAALIEARSGERLGLLRDHAPDEAVRELCAALYPPEERHAELLFELAGRCGETADRLDELARAEAALIAAGEAWVRVHA